MIYFILSLSMLIIAPFYQTGLQAASPALSKEVDICRQNILNWPPIAYAVDYKMYDVVKYLIDEGENIEKRTPSISVYIGSSKPYSDPSQIIRNYIEKEKGFTPLELAIRKDDLKMVDILLNYSKTNHAQAEKGILRYNEKHLTDFEYLKYLQIVPPLPLHEAGFINAVECRTYDFSHLGNGSSKYSAPKFSITPLDYALKSAKFAQMVPLVLASYTDLNQMLVAYEIIVAKGNITSLHHWLERYLALGGSLIRILPDEKIERLLQSSFLQALQIQDEQSCNDWLNLGWMVSQEEMDLLIQNNELALIERIIEDNLYQANANPFDRLLFHGKEDLIDQHLSRHLFSQGFAAICKYDSLKLYRSIESVVSFHQARHQALLLAAKYGSLNIAAHLVNQGIKREGVLLQAVKYRQTEMVRFLLVSQHTTYEEGHRAFLLAKEMGAQDIVAVFVEVVKSGAIPIPGVIPDSYLDSIKDFIWSFF